MEVLQQVLGLRGVGLFLCQVDVGIDIPDQRIEFRFGGKLIVRALAFAEHTLSLLLIVPEARLRNSIFEFFQLLAEMRNVKENSARGRCAALDLHSGTANLQESFSLPKSL